jgi:hypothetical protein
MRVDPDWMHALLALHIAAGTVCLMLAPLVLAVTKGSRRHRRWGKVYFWSVAVMTSTALPLALFRPVLFLAFLAVLSFYLAFSGYRVLSLKNLASGGNASAADWVAAIVTFAACAALASFAFLRPSWVQNMGIVAIVLGALGMRGAALDMYRFVHKPTDRMFWLYVHLQKFIGSYVTVWTAFTVVTVSQIFHNPGPVIWLLPAGIGVPAIIATEFWFRRKNAMRLEASAV